MLRQPNLVSYYAENTKKYEVKSVPYSRSNDIGTTLGNWRSKAKRKNEGFQKFACRMLVLTRLDLRDVQISH